MRFLGVDYGRKRLGLALSDPSGRLARPWQTIAAGGSPAAASASVIRAIETFARDGAGDERVEAVVVGLPARLNGEPTDATAAAQEFARRLAAASALPVHLQDERLSSHEADARLREQEPDWRVRKRKLDAAAAAIILQDFLDHQPDGS